MFDLLTPEKLANYLPDVANQPIERLVKNLLDGKYDGKKLFLAVRYIIKSGYRFETTKELQALRQTHANFGWGLALLFARFGYVFSQSDLAIIGTFNIEGIGVITPEFEMKRYAFSLSQTKEHTLYEAMLFHDGNPLFVSGA